MPSRSVLLVEDDDALRNLYRTSLTHAGFAVAEAADGVEALRRIDEAPPALLILDLLLPRISGYGVLHDLSRQAHTRHIPVIVVTGTNDRIDHGSVVAVLRKAVSPDELVRAARHAIESRIVEPS